MSKNQTSLEFDGRFLLSVQESYAKYNEHGARSTEKLRPLHQWVSDEIQSALGSRYAIRGLRKESQGAEDKISGKYYDKNVDISICKQDVPLAVISVKFITSNFKQNANNYFEHLMGETANIRRGDVGFGHFMVLPYKLPYFNKGGESIRIETVKNAHLQKYVKLAQDCDYPHKPDAIGIGVISLPLDDLENFSGIGLIDLNQTELSADIKSALAGELSASSFISKMKALVEQKK